MKLQTRSKQIRDSKVFIAFLGGKSNRYNNIVIMLLIFKSILSFWQFPVLSIIARHFSEPGQVFCTVVNCSLFCLAWESLR